MLTLTAIVLTVAFAYGVVEAALTLAGDSFAGRLAVYGLAFVTGLIVPWAIVDAVASRNDGE